MIGGLRLPSEAKYAKRRFSTIDDAIVCAVIPLERIASTVVREVLSGAWS